MADNNVSVADKPVGSHNEDRLGTQGYAGSLSNFIQNCQTPLTIGIQGEWGSGKTSLLNMIKENLEQAEVRKSVKGKDVYHIIWLNTWEHALLKTPEECLLSIVEEIISDISKVDGSWNAASKAKTALATLARGAIRVGASATLGAKGAQVADEMLGEGAHNSVKALRNSLAEIIGTIKNRGQNPVQRFVIFVDDLDRLDPKVAVQILELLKNIFDLEHCVFVLAIDYQVVVKGLEFKFGKPTEDNEWEFRAFFDKIIQLPFMMPMTAYNLQNYIVHMLTTETQIFSGRLETNLLKAGTLAKVVRLTIGYNPRALKRLTNALSLINIYNKDEIEKSGENFKVKQLIFALICLQISYPKVYELLLANPKFLSWNDEFSNKITGGPHQENVELRKALERAVTVNEDEFDDEWEKALFKIVWLKGWQKSKLVETSRLLTIIKEDILGIKDEILEAEVNAAEKLMDVALRMTSVTAVISDLDNQVTADDNGADTEISKWRIKYWEMFSNAMKGSENVFDPIKTPIKDNYFSGWLYRRHQDLLPDELQFVAQTGSTSPLKFESHAGDPKAQYLRFRYLRTFRSALEEASNTKVKFVGEEDSARQQLIFLPPNGIKKRIRLENPTNRDIAVEIHKWMREILPKIESILIDALEAEDGFADSQSISTAPQSKLHVEQDAEAQILEGDIDTGPPLPDQLK